MPAPQPAPTDAPRPTPTLPAEITVRELTTAAELARLRPEWQRLLAASPGATPFHGPEWLLPWAAHFGRDGVLVLVAQRGDRVVALAPLWAADGAGGRSLSFLGHGISDYGGFLVGPEGDGAADALLAHLARRSWDVCHLDQIPPGDPAHGARLPPGLVEQVQPADPCPVVDLPASVGELVEALPHRLGPRVQRSLRRLEREGPARFEAADGRTLDEMCEALFRLHGDRWQTREQPGVLADPTLQRFHRDVIAGMHATGRLRMHGLRMHGRIEAVIYAFAHGPRLYSYLGGFTPALAAVSPGSVMIWHTMARAIEEGLREFDFLRGAEAYKYRWGARDHWNTRRLLRPAT